MTSHEFQVIVIGAGHAGIEAALVASRMGCRTALVTFSASTIGQMSCNPAIGGVGKGQLVKEIDVLGGKMALAADRTAVQFRQLNASKGQAVRSSRCQSDRRLYQQYMERAVTSQPGLTVIADEAAEVLVRGGRVTGVRTARGQALSAPAVVITPGTFLDGRIHLGQQITPAGRVGEPAAVRLKDSLLGLGLEVQYFKTGTPPRLDGRTIDFSGMEVQLSDDPPVPFSFRTPAIPAQQRMLPCHITRTTEATYEIIRSNLHLSPMYSGQIHATGVRYCPSIEDKIKKFPHKITHHVFLEPEGLDTDLIYPNGISTGLPADVQEAMVRSIKGLERAVMTRPGYSIEHGIVPPTELTADLQTKKVTGLYLAGQINGTTGYEEAAAQGLLAGINAALQVKGRRPLILGRHESYIGVLIDDLTSRGTDEPYRMFTSRVEYRLIVREDNADRRLARYAVDLGLMSRQDHEKILAKYDLIDEEIRHLKTTRVKPGGELDRLLQSSQSQPLKQPTSLSDILRRPEVTYRMIAPFDGKLKDCPPRMIEQVEYEIKYEGFIKRQLKDVRQFRHIENIRIPPAMDYTCIPGLSTELQQKLMTFTPRTLGQAYRIRGMTPAAISLLMIYVRKLSLQRRRAQRTNPDPTPQAGGDHEDRQ